MCWSLDASDVAAARAARKEIRAALCEFSATEEILGSAELVVGELLSNATRHAGGHVCIELNVEGGHAQISVHDTSPVFELDFTRLPDAYSENGRGLFIISELARKIAVVPHDGLGKRVMVTLDLPISARGALEPSCQRAWLRGGNSVCLYPRLRRYPLASLAGYGNP